MEIRANDHCTVSLDREFGPGIRCPQFDFTLTFEHWIFGITTSVAFIILVFLRLWRLVGKDITSRENPILWAKAVRFKFLCAVGL